MFYSNTKYPIGIDIGNRNIYAAQLKENKQGLVVSGLVHREYQGGGDGVLNAAKTIVPLLKDVVRNKRLKGRRVVVNIPDQYVLSFPLSFQVGKDETVEGAILKNSRQYLTFPPEEAVIDYPSLTTLSGDEGSRFKASIVAARTDHVSDYLSMLKQAGLTVEVVDFTISSLLRLHSYPHKTIQNPLILCNVGATQSMLSILTTESILVQRHIPWGVQTLVSNLQANLELSDDKERAKVLLKKYGLFYEDCLECNIETTSTASGDSDESRDMYRAIYQIINPLIEELVHECHKVIGYARSEEQDAVFEGIYIYGQGTFINHLDRYLEKRLNIQTRLMNPLTKVALADDSVAADLSEGGPFGLALGLALRKVIWL
jgi:type IV pilus assembly protein PilM